MTLPELFTSLSLFFKFYFNFLKVKNFIFLIFKKIFWCGSFFKFSSEFVAILLLFYVLASKTCGSLAPHRGPYNYTVEMKYRYKGLDLITDCLKNYGHRFMTLYRKQWSRHYQEKEMQKGNKVVWGGLTNNWERREAKDKGEKERYIHLNAKFQRIARRDKKAFLSNQCKEI